MISFKRLIPTVEEAKKYACEFWGTFALSFFVPFSLGYSRTPYAAIVGGFLLTGIIYALGAKSGAQVNPALTITLFMADPGAFSVKDLVYYVLSQCAGGVCGALMTVGSVARNPETFHIAFTNNEEHHVQLYQAFGAEVLGVGFFFWLAIQIAADLSNAYYALGIGFVNIATVVVLAPISGAGINPAVVLGSNLVADIWGCNPPHHGPSLTWTRTTVYSVAEILGGMLSLVLLAMTTYEGPAPEPEEKAAEGVLKRPPKRQSLLMTANAGGGNQWAQATPMVLGEGASKVVCHPPRAKQRPSLLLPVPSGPSEMQTVTETTPLTTTQRKPPTHSRAPSPPRGERWVGEASNA